MLLQRGEFLILDRPRAGQPQPCLILAGEVEIKRRLPDRLSSLLARLERTIIENRLDLNEAAQIAWLGRLVVDEIAPREARLPPGHDILDRLGKHVERGLHVIEREEVGGGAAGQRTD